MNEVKSQDGGSFTGCCKACASEEKVSKLENMLTELTQKQELINESLLSQLSELRLMASSGASASQ